MTRKLPERAILVQAYLTLSRSATWMSSGFRLERRLWLKACVRGAGPFPQTVRALEPSATGSRYTDESQLERPSVLTAFPWLIRSSVAASTDSSDRLTSATPG